MPAEGGEARRLTFQAGGACTVTGWDPSGSVIYMSDAGLGQARQPDAGTDHRSSSQTKITESPWTVGRRR